MSIVFKSIPTARAERYWSGEPDENNQHPEIAVSDGSGNPCRHCLTDIPKGEKMLILGYRPEQKINPYAEVGPIFLCAEKCESHVPAIELPQIFDNTESLLVRGYDGSGRIVYGTGRVVETQRVKSRAMELFEDQGVDYIHIRSASNNCFQCKIERSET